jgi:hypothetical protein
MHASLHKVSTLLLAAAGAVLSLGRVVTVTVRRASGRAAHRMWYMASHRSPTVTTVTVVRNPVAAMVAMVGAGAAFGRVAVSAIVGTCVVHPTQREHQAEGASGDDG